MHLQLFDGAGPSMRAAVALLSPNNVHHRLLAQGGDGEVFFIFMVIGPRADKGAKQASHLQHFDGASGLPGTQLQYVLGVAAVLPFIDHRVPVVWQVILGAVGVAKHCYGLVSSHLEVA